MLGGDRREVAVFGGGAAGLLPFVVRRFRTKWGAARSLEPRARPGSRLRTWSSRRWRRRSGSAGTMASAAPTLMDVGGSALRQIPHSGALLACAARRPPACPPRRAVDGRLAQGHATARRSRFHCPADRRLREPTIPRSRGCRCGVIGGPWRPPRPLGGTRGVRPPRTVSGVALGAGMFEGEGGRANVRGSHRPHPPPHPLPAAFTIARALGGEPRTPASCCANQRCPSAMCPRVQRNHGHATLER